MNMMKWDLRFLKLAEHISTWSLDPSTKCGSVIVDNKNRLISVGFNGFPRGISDDERLHNREKKLRIVQHAESNAILFSNVSLEGCTLYCWPFSPCGQCAGRIIQSGIKWVKFPVCDDREKLNRWADEFMLASDLFKEANIRVVKYDMEKLTSLS